MKLSLCHEWGVFRLLLPCAQLDTLLTSLNAVGTSVCYLPLEKTGVHVAAELLFLVQTDILLVFHTSALITLCEVWSALPGGEDISGRSIPPPLR